MYVSTRKMQHNGTISMQFLRRHARRGSSNEATGKGYWQALTIPLCFSHHKEVHKASGPPGAQDSSGPDGHAGTVLLRSVLLGREGHAEDAIPSQPHF